MRFLLLALLGLTCLPARSQAINPLRPLVVRLDSGTITRRVFVGLDPATYQAVRLGQISDEQLLAIRAARIDNLLRLRRADSLAYVRQSLELRASQADVARTSADLSKQEVRTRNALAQRAQKPLLLDPNTYIGGLVGVLAAGLLKIYVFH